jgi:hypothetical protein
MNRKKLLISCLGCHIIFQLTIAATLLLLEICCRTTARTQQQQPAAAATAVTANNARSQEPTSSIAW